MKKIFEIIAIVSLTLFSFYYTNKIVDYKKESDVIYTSILEYKNKFDVKCKEGLITSDGVVLGMTGIIIDVDKSYQTMKGIGFNKNNVVTKSDDCIITKEQNIDKYIIGGNKNKNSVSLIIDINDGFFLKKIINILNKYNISSSFTVNDKTSEINKKLLLNLDNLNNDILYSGSSEIMINSLKKEFDNLYCINNSVSLCSKNDIFTIKSNKIYNNNYLYNIKNDVKSGDFIILKENNELLNELDNIIKYFNNKGYKIISLTEHLK